MASALPPPGPDGVPKHRACDECRSRKLACSKEPEGCSRCRKEAIPCHYSPQKPMGRPRKRRHVEQDAPQPLPQDFVHHDMTATGALGAVGPPSQPPITINDFQMQTSALATDQDLSFLDETNPSGMEFWDLLPGNYMEMPTDPNLFLSAAETENAAVAGPTLTTTTTTSATMVIPPLNLSGVDLLGSIDFDEPDHSAAVSRDLSASLQRYMAEHVSLPQGTSTSTPVDSTLGSDHGTSVGSPEDSTSTPPPPPSMRAVPTIHCSCLSSLFLALDNLSRLPPEVIPAMRVARNASKVAHDVINCPSCSVPLLDDPGAAPPIQSFQNLMFLGTLVPSACNAYATILDMVDREAASARKQGRTFWFSFKDLGGLWGKVGENADADRCSSIRNYNNSSMSPDLWRATIRGLLRLDVYGMDELDDGIHTAGPYTQIGLRDVVRLLEERTRKRHEILDSLVASGQTKALPVGIIYPSKPCTPEERNCVRILETARVALDNLVIA